MAPCTGAAVRNVALGTASTEESSGDARRLSAQSTGIDPAESKATRQYQLSTSLARETCWGSSYRSAITRWTMSTVNSGSAAWPKLRALLSGSPSLASRGIGQNNASVDIPAGRPWSRR